LSGLNDRLRALVRESEGKRCRPAAAAMDSQTVGSAAHLGVVGYDPGKRTKGRKRFLSDSRNDARIRAFNPLTMGPRLNSQKK
jgi:hypothetical protein